MLVTGGEAAVREGTKAHLQDGGQVRIGSTELNVPLLGAASLLDNSDGTDIQVCREFVTGSEREFVALSFPS